MKEVQFQGRSILIADDEEYVRHHLAKRLSEMGLRVLQAGTGEEALDLAGMNPDLILMDVRMPVLDGLETAKMLKSRDETRDIPLVLLSAMAQQEEVIRGLATGADEYIVKPVTFQRLLESIRTHIV